MPKILRLAYGVTALLALAASFASAAVVHEFSFKQTAPFVMGGPWGVAVDDLGDVYATDTGAHRIVKFDNLGNPITAWGSEGSGAGQFYYPLGVAVNSGVPAGGIRVYVADDGNHRIVTFNRIGQFMSAFGSEGSGKNQFNHPRGIAVVPRLGGGTEEICVADTGNDRISCFDEFGNWRRSFDCADCPDGKFVDPQGIAVRMLDGGAIRYYVTDNYPARVVVLNSNGRHVRTMGAPGQPAQLGFPDDIAVDKKSGAIYVADSGIGYERITKFDADGEWRFDFNAVPGGGLVQPHAIAIDSDGDLVVGHFAEPPMHKFRIDKSRIKAVPSSGLRTWVEDVRAYMYVSYNGIEQACRARINLAVTADGLPWTIRTAVADVKVTNEQTNIALPLSAAQANRLAAALDAQLSVTVMAGAAAKCPNDGSEFTSRTKTVVE